MAAPLGIGLLLRLSHRQNRHRLRAECKCRKEGSGSNTSRQVLESVPQARAQHCASWHAACVKMARSLCQGLSQSV